MDSIKLDFEQAKAKHLLFKSRLRSLLYGAEVDEAPVVSHHECTVGKWIYGHALKEYGHVPEMQELEKVHAEIHTVARRLVDVYKAGKVQEARNGLSRVEDISDDLIQLLGKVEKKVAAEPEVLEKLGEYQTLEVTITELNDLVKANEQLDKMIRSQSGELLRERQILHDFFMQAPAVLAILKGPEHLFELANPPYIQLIGNRDPVGKTVREALPELEGQGFFELLDKVFKTGESFIGKEMPASLDRGNGTLDQIYINFTYQAYTNAEGNIEGILVFAYDVTEQVTARQKIEELELSTRIAIEAADLGVFDWNLENQDFKSSPRLIEIFGFGHDEVSHDDLISRFHPDDKPIRDKAVAESEAQGGLTYEARLIWKDSSVHWVRVHGKILRNEAGKPIRMYGTVMDITEAKKAITEVIESEQRAKFIIEAMPQKVWTADKDGNVNYFNQHWMDFTGRSFEELKEWGWQDIIHPDDVEENIRLWKHSIQTGEDFQFEHRFKQGNGEYRWHLSRGIAQKDSAGNITMWVGTNTDIHDNKILAEQLQEAYNDLEMKVTFRNLDLERLNRANEAKIEELQNELNALRS